MLVRASRESRDVSSSTRGRSNCSRLHARKCTAGASRSSCSADLIDWPQGLRPRSGNVTKTALLRLKVADLREELNRRALETEGTKEQLVLELFNAVQDQIQEASANPLEELGGRWRRIPGELCSQSLDDVWVDGEMPPDVTPDNPEALLEWLGGNLTRIQIIFLGTSSAQPMVNRSLGSIALRTVSDTWLFDAGEDAQRQCLKHPLMKPGKISRVFLTSLKGTTAFGLPGILCSIASSRGRGAAHTDQPVHVYGPPGTGDFVVYLMDLSDTYLEIPVIIHEFCQRPSSMQLRHLARRAKIWKVDIPPDGLNANGFYDARLDSTRPLKRRLAKKGRRAAALNTVDRRAGFKPFNLPSPGNTSRYPLSDDEICWTLKISDEFLVTVHEMKAGVFGYRLEEADRSGNFNLERARSYGLKPGKEFGVLKSGGSVVTESGAVVTPEMVLSDDRPGRTITILGATPDSSTPSTTLTRKADCLIAPIESDAFIGNGLSLESITQFAQASTVKTLIFSRTPPWDREWLDSEMETLARDAELRVVSAFDLYTHVVPSVE